MRKVILGCVCMLLHVMALAQGIYFEKISVKEALEKAQKEKKMVFVDMWATWCVPCKMLANSLFTQKEVGSYMNSHFICVKCDIDTQEGKILKKKYGVRRVPTLLILQPDGEIRCFMLGGSRQKGEFLEWANLGLSEKSSLSYLENLAREGKRMTKKNLNDYFIVLEARRDFSDSVRWELFRRLSVKERSRPEYWKLFRDQVGDNRYFHFVEDHVAEFRANIGREEIDDYLFQGFSRIVRKCAYEKVGDSQAIELIERTCNNLAKLTLNRGEDGKGIDYKILVLEARLVKSYLQEDIQAMLHNMRVLVNMGEWWDCAWFPVSYIAHRGTRDEHLILTQLGREIVLNIEDTRKQWEYIQKFKELGFSISCLESIWAQVTVEAKKQGKKILLEVVDSEDAGCQKMNRRLSMRNMSHFIDSLCVDIRIDARSLDGMNFLHKRQIVNYSTPVYWLLDSDGRIEHVWAGVCDDEEFCESFLKGLEGKSSYRYLKSRIEQKTYSFDELIAYLDVLRKADMMEEYNRICSNYFCTLSDEDKVNRSYWPLVSRITYDMREYDYVVSHFIEYEKNVGRMALQNYFIGVFKQVLEQEMELLRAGEKTNLDFQMERLKKVQIECTSLNLQHIDTLLCMSNMALAYLRKDIDDWLGFAIKSVDYQRYEDGSWLDITMGLLEEKAEKKHRFLTALIRV